MSAVDFGLVPGFKLGPAIVLGLTLVLFIAVGIASRARSEEEFWVARRDVGPVSNGMALASNWISVGSFLGLAGLIYLQGFGALAYVVGWSGGYVLLLVLMASQLQRFGRFTTADLVAERFQSTLVRSITAVVTIVIAIVYSVAQYQGIGLVFGWIFGLGYTESVVLGSIVVLGYVVLSGMLGVTRNQVVQYVILAVAFTLPLFFVANRAGYFPLIPHLGYGTVVHEIGTDPTAAWYDPLFVAPFAHRTAFGWISLAFTLMVGTMGLPHVITRFYTVGTERGARWSVVWGLLFIGVIYWAAPAYASFARVFQAGARPSESVADLTVIGATALAGLPAWFAGFLAAGAIAAAFATTAGLLSAGAGAVSHDLYHNVFRPDAGPGERMLVARVATAALGLAIMVLALRPPGLLAEVVGGAFALAADTLFPVIVLGIWWRRATREGAVAGLVTGLALWSFSAWGGWYGGIGWIERWLPVEGHSLLVAPVVFIVVAAVSLVTRPTSGVGPFLDRIHGGPFGVRP